MASKHTGPYSPRYDWELIRLDYESGLLNDASIAAKHGVTVGRLKQVAKKERWVRRPPPSAEEIHGSSPLPGRTTTSTKSEPLDPETIRQNAVVTVQAVLETHRKDINKLRATAGVLVARLCLILEGKEVSLPCLGSRESPADLLEKLSRVTVRTVQLERQAFNLDNMPQNPDGAATDDATVKAVQSDLDELKAKLDAIGNNKARQAEEEKK